jgi:hypothetical protein
MRDVAPSLYKHVSYLVEIALGLVLLLNGILLLINSSALLSFKEKFSNFLSAEQLLSKSAQEWRVFIEFLHVIMATHIMIVVLIFAGIVIFLAGLHTKRSL